MTRPYPNEACGRCGHSFECHFPENGCDPGRSIQGIGRHCKCKEFVRVENPVAAYGSLPGPHVPLPAPIHRPDIEPPPEMPRLREGYYWVRLVGDKTHKGLTVMHSDQIDPGVHEVGEGPLPYPRKKQVERHYCDSRCDAISDDLRISGVPITWCPFCGVELV